MKKNIIISFIVLLSLIISCSNSSSSSQQQTETKESAASYKNLTVDEVVTLWKSNPDIILIDVRTPDEIKETGAIEGATNIDFKAPDFKENVSSLDKSREYIIFCRSGNRSGQASQIMADLGFTNINNLNNAGYDEFSKALAQ
ncbi:rhodanese-like domain-containing protein [Brachyspira alvinipulli]|uniref:rhodanese-like domain-containing protein n=1 Tax=Brachyspira alvinipulli TaxID=84379 RepID=UPI00047F3968|nr:rhodanese-like domain-containing protein [Brachyspira alvinipulli]